MEEKSWPKRFRCRQVQLRTNLYHLGDRGPVLSAVFQRQHRYRGIPFHWHMTVKTFTLFFSGGGKPTFKFASVTGNQQAVAAQLESITNPTPDELLVLQSLSALSPAGQQLALSDRVEKVMPRC